METAPSSGCTYNSTFYPMRYLSIYPHFTGSTSLDYSDVVVYTSCPWLSVPFLAPSGSVSSCIMCVSNAGRDVDIHFSPVLLGPDQCYQLHITGAVERPLSHGNNNAYCWLSNAYITLRVRVTEDPAGVYVRPLPPHLRPPGGRSSTCSDRPVYLK